ncbi:MULTISPECIES: portal protein [unclassified Cupriavidus]|uniref:portal protein n=2 Tax=Cupriavidus TaxID=106589 RepID=UPI001BFFE649|nr:MULTISPECIES: portal protein [unclassified Cupriavidus]MCA3188318.1 head-tail connector protein [Cupriavidus sp.]MCA3189828.1 head-tail connector protein [Cupriavidus sp.]MCA3196422.1 head-tail connector protein [Cupriavidus sp.]MCA3202167.1 head-tail connector protein [Cupriavidus sp.]QWE93306.1 head-tail connector protein [Cupriavidus sp. EM10]
MQGDSRATEILRRLTAMKGVRSDLESVWLDCFDHCFPMRGNGFFGNKDDATSMQTKRAKLLDATSTDSGRILAAALMSGATPSNSRWFGLSAGQDTDEEKRWFDESAETIWENIHASNYDAVGYECCQDMVGAGWFVMYIDVDREVGGYQFEQWPLSGCYLATSKAGGRADTLIRCYEQTVEQIVNEFGVDKVSDQVRQLYEQDKLDNKIQLLHSIYPRQIHAVDAVRAKNMPFASCKVEVASKHTLSESGYHECPFVAPRWVVVPDTPYAMGPMFDALPDVKQLNRLVYLEDTNADIAISGMWIAEDDGVLNPRTVKIGPRKIIVANSVDSMKPLTSGANFNLSFTKKEELQRAIRKILMADQLQPQDGPAMTATEVHVRVQMIRQLLGPIYGRLQAEWLQGMVQRCFGLAYRAGVLTPPPQSLDNREFRVTFKNPQAQAQKLEDVNAVELTVAAVGNMAALKQDPSVWDNIDTDEAARVVAEGRAAPARIMRDKDAVAVMREQRAQQVQQAQQQAAQQEIMQPAAQEMAKRMAAA